MLRRNSVLLQPRFFFWANLVVRSSSYQILQHLHLLVLTIVLGTTPWICHALPCSSFPPWPQPQPCRIHLPPPPPTLCHSTTIHHGLPLHHGEPEVLGWEPIGGDHPRAHQGLPRRRHRGRPRASTVDASELFEFKLLRATPIWSK